MNDITPEEIHDEAYVSPDERTINEARFVEESQPFIDELLGIPKANIDERTLEA